MGNIIWGANGNPIGYSGKHSFGFAVRDFKTNKGSEPVESFIIRYGNEDIEFVSWGPNNLFPEDAIDVISSTNVLQTGLDYKARICYGQGMVPMVFDGFDEEGNEVVKPVNDVKLCRELRGYVVRHAVQGILRDMNKFGNAIACFTFSDDGSRIVAVDALNMRHCRISRDKRWVAYYPDYEKQTPDISCKDLVLLPMLNEVNPWVDLDALKMSNKLGRGKMKRVCFPRLKNYFCNNDYYALPVWWSAKESGWIDIAHRVPAFLKHVYTNAMTMMWQVNIPNSFFDSQFPKQDYINDMAKRKDDIAKWMEELDESLAGEHNAYKSFITKYMGSGETGKADEKVEIIRLKNEIEAKEQLSTSAAANSEILFALMVNPSVMGAGMPGGAYAGNAGSGSDIRESALVSIVLSHLDKEAVLDPIEMMIEFNGYKDIELRFKRTILTTLNTGNSVEEGIE